MLHIFKNTKVLKKRNLLINGAVFILSYGVLFRYFKGIDIHESISFLGEALSSIESILLIGLIVLLSFVNWMIESYKWKFVISPLIKLPYADALKSVLIGIFFSLFIPNRAGDFLGRVYSVSNSDKGKLSILTLLASYAQLLATLIFGTVGLTFFYFFYKDAFIQINLYLMLALVCSWIACFVGVILYFKSSILVTIGRSRKSRFVLKIKSWVEILRNVHAFNLFVVLELSILRYFIFSFQMWLCLKLVGVDLNSFDVFFFITVYYLVLTFIPTVVYTEIGIRGSLSIYLFGLLLYITGTPEYDYQFAVSFASVLVWIVNIVMPAILGSFYSRRLKFFKK